MSYIKWINITNFYINDLDLSFYNFRGGKSLKAQISVTVYCLILFTVINKYLKQMYVFQSSKHGNSC